MRQWGTRVDPFTRLEGCKPLRFINGQNTRIVGSVFNCRLGGEIRVNFYFDHLLVFKLLVSEARSTTCLLPCLSRVVSVLSW